jgi:hypothetical protein
MTVSALIPLYDVSVIPEPVMMKGLERWNDPLKVILRQMLRVNGNTRPSIEHCYAELKLIKMEKKVLTAPIKQ